MSALKQNMARWIWLGIVGAMAILLAWALWPRATKVDVAEVDRGLVRVEIVDEGRTRIKDVFVVAAPVGGELQRIELHAGDTVATGQIIARILPADPALLDARTKAETSASAEAARAALVAAQASLDLARKDQQRMSRLAGGGVASVAALDSANAALRVAVANVAARRADLARTQATLGGGGARARRETFVRAPAAGRVLRVLQESEGIAPAGTPLIEIGDPRNLEIVAEYLSQDAVGLRPGASATIENWGGPEPLAAIVDRIEPFARTRVSALGVEEQRVNVILRLLPRRDPPVFGHAYRVDVRAVLAEYRDAVRAPTDALVREGANWAVFKLVGGHARLTPIVLGAGDAHYRVVQSGLSAGDIVILFPGDAVRDGVSVNARAPAVKQVSGSGRA